MSRTFLFLHGGGMGGWTWRYVREPLERAGHRVLTPTFTGFGERVHLLSAAVTNATHVQDIVNVLDYEDLGEVILVGHSYAGSIIPGVVAARAERIARIVYVDALVVHSGETVMGAMGYMPEEQASAMRAGLASGKVPPETGVHVQQRKLVESGEDPMDMAEDRKAWLLDKLSDMPLGGVVTPVVHGAETLGLPVEYLAASNTVMGPMHARAKALGWAVYPYQGDHSMLVGDPEILLDRLDA